LLTRTELRHTSFDAGPTLQKKIDAAVAGVRNAHGEASQRDLPSMLLAGLLQGLSERHLLVIADGPLNQVPFAALPMPDGSGQLLVDRFVIAFAPSLATTLRAPVRAPDAGSLVAIVADPVYSSRDRRLLDITLASSGPPRGTDAVAGTERLPYSAIEAREVGDAMRARNVVTLAGFDATVARVIALPRDRLAVLHFATHASAQSDSPGESALYLSGYAQDGSRIAHDRLTADDIIRSGLRAELVVLSGCDTGGGSALRGEGVLGLTYGFLANGSRAVVASLWPVEDAAASVFMREFYAAYRGEGQVADALRTAQLRTRGTPAGATVWASFVVRTTALP
jgi:CHAT domain-containing protein